MEIIFRTNILLKMRKSDDNRALVTPITVSIVL